MMFCPGKHFGYPTINANSHVIFSGLTAKRPKHLKNPRVKNKLKFQRKKKIHKSMVPQVLRETNRYSGEASGIRAGRIRSVQLS